MAWKPSKPPNDGLHGKHAASFCIRSQLECLAKLTTYAPVSEPNGCPEMMPAGRNISSLPLLHEHEEEEEGARQQFFAIRTVMIDLMRRQAVLSPAGCPKTEQKFNHTAPLVWFWYVETRMIPTEKSLSDAIRRGIDWVL